MKKLFFFLPLFILSLLCSCNDDNTDPVHTEKPSAILKLNLTLGGGGLWVHTLNDEVVGNSLNYNMSNVASLIYVIHSVEDEKWVKLFDMGREEIKEILQEDNSVTTDITLPFGEYYVTMIVTTHDRLEHRLITSGLMQDYSKAACQVPNNSIFYTTMKVDCMPPNGLLPQYVEKNIEFTADALLKHITGEFVFLLPKGDKGIPANANFSMEVEIANLPSAFYIKNGQTLSSKEAEEMGMYQYNKTFTITSNFESQLVAKYSLLANHNLADTPEERGSFKFVYKEDATSNVETKMIKLNMQERKQDENHFSSGLIFICDLYDSEAPEIIEPEVINSVSGGK